MNACLHQTSLGPLTADHNRRIREIDDLVADGAVPTPGSGTLIEVNGAVGVHSIADIDPDSIEASWDELRRHTLSQIRVSGPNAARNMESLLSAWRSCLEDCPIPDHGESAAVLSWPSRDAEVVNLLRNSGFTPTAILAARVGRALPGREIPPTVIRPIASRDLAAVTALHVALTRWDDNFGGAHWRASTPTRKRDYVAKLIDAPRTCAWVAEIDGEIVDTSDVEWPETARWVTSELSTDPATTAYVGTMCVASGRRGIGIGSALATHVHRELEEGGANHVVVHFAPLNPLSSRFWLRAGYRPVITTWTAQPHTAIRQPRRGLIS